MADGNDPIAARGWHGRGFDEIGVPRLEMLGSGAR
jgi:hypothetical protein